MSLSSITGRKGWCKLEACQLLRGWAASWPTRVAMRAVLWLYSQQSKVLNEDGNRGGRGRQVHSQCNTDDDMEVLFSPPDSRQIAKGFTNVIPTQTRLANSERLVQQ